MRDLNLVPVMGWETANCNANKACEKRALEYFDAKKDTMFKGKMFKNLTEDARQQLIVTTQNKMIGKCRSGHIRRNIGKAISYAPGICSIKGVINFIGTAATPKKDCPNKYKHLARAGVETFSLGFIFFIPDLIVTLNRKDKKPMPSNNIINP